ncbi:tRNA (mo5U34)-methyltransferase [Halopseudomonas xinjiangensis]|uniref:tRNA U34 carboxymethyltransferase n=1 Tax=Halopseudomonas xinjiangensis TaxID=487184 RepID=A0A1H1PXB5_9GAMM|nr:tRNA 5-methoxyuridine(34)/uridine 5-oxyacetic acid(34) synthase CmoB [Halopseudomonas xinjiangensis]SDS15835.1 tRNA (mo5U34)-methyltransferase [Halopseudomonas xinjiangensis]
MIDYSPLFEQLRNTSLEHWLDPLPAALDQRLALASRHGDLPRWQACLAQLPDVESPAELADGVRVGRSDQLDDTSRAQLEQALRGLHPWRKGPFELFGVHIDTEWRSDWKWQRVAPHLDLHGKRILDVGCGNGYYMWRMWGAGAAMVIGVDPNLLFMTQFEAVRKYLPEAPVWQLPFTLEDLPEPTEGFDTVFSMGVLYHRRSPIDHLLQLRACLRPGGELVLETLVIEGDETACLVPEDRYAQMRNVWFLPSVSMLERFVRRAGFSSVRCVDLNRTSTEEQRTTDWMRFQSLPDFLDAHDASRTCEGYPAPLRATLVATR